MPQSQELIRKRKSHAVESIYISSSSSISEWSEETTQACFNINSASHSDLLSSSSSASDEIEEMNPTCFYINSGQSNFVTNNNNSNNKFEFQLELSCSDDSPDESEISSALFACLDSLADLAIKREFRVYGSQARFRSIDRSVLNMLSRLPAPDLTQFKAIWSTLPRTLDHLMAEFFSAFEAM